MTDRPLDLAEAAAWLRVNEETLRRLAKRGGIPGRKIGGWKFLMQDLLDYVRHDNKQQEGAWPTASTSSRPARIGTSISGLTKPGELDAALKPKIKPKRKPTPNIVRPKFGEKKNLEKDHLAPGTTR